LLLHIASNLLSYVVGLISRGIIVLKKLPHILAGTTKNERKFATMQLLQGC